MFLSLDSEIAADTLLYAPSLFDMYFGIIGRILFGRPLPWPFGSPFFFEFGTSKKEISTTSSKIPNGTGVHQSTLSNGHLPNGGSEPELSSVVSSLPAQPPKSDRPNQGGGDASGGAVGIVGAAEGRLLNDAEHCHKVRKKL